jgi:hypothetical protein
MNIINSVSWVSSSLFFQWGINIVIPYCLDFDADIGFLFVVLVVYYYFPHSSSFKKDKILYIGHLVKNKF